MHNLYNIQITCMLTDDIHVTRYDSHLDGPDQNIPLGIGRLLYPPSQISAIVNPPGKRRHTPLPYDYIKDSRPARRLDITFTSPPPLDHPVQFSRQDAAAGRPSQLEWGKMKLTFKVGIAHAPSFPISWADLSERTSSNRSSSSKQNRQRRWRCLGSTRYWHS